MRSGINFVFSVFFPHLNNHTLIQCRIAYSTNSNITWWKYSGCAWFCTRWLAWLDREHVFYYIPLWPHNFKLSVNKAVYQQSYKANLLERSSKTTYKVCCNRLWKNSELANCHILRYALQRRKFMLIIFWHLHLAWANRSIKHWHW